MSQSLLKAWLYKWDLMKQSHLFSSILSVPVCMLPQRDHKAPNPEPFWPLLASITGTWFRATQAKSDLSYMMKSTWVHGHWVQSMTRDQTAWPPPSFGQCGKSNKYQSENSSSIDPSHVFKATSRKSQSHVWTRGSMVRRNGPLGPGVT